MTKLHDVTFNKTSILMQLRIINKTAVKCNNVYCLTVPLYKKVQQNKEIEYFILILLHKA